MLWSWERAGKQCKTGQGTDGDAFWINGCNNLPGPHGGPNFIGHSVVVPTGRKTAVARGSYGALMWHAAHCSLAAGRTIELLLQLCLPC